VRETKSQTVLESFVKRYGDSFYADIARDRIEALKKGPGRSGGAASGSISSYVSRR
jgi:hypothetical protein